MDNSQPPIKCPTCGALALADAHFCVECGSSMRGVAGATGTRAMPRRPTDVGGNMPRVAPLRPVPPPLSSAKARKGAKTQVLTETGAGLSREEATPASMAEAFASATGEVVVAAVVPAPEFPLPAEIPPPTAQDLPSATSPPAASSGTASTGAGNGMVQSAQEPAMRPAFNLMLDDIDNGFDAIVGHGPSRPPAASRPEDLVEPQALFAQIAATQTRPIRDFMMELKLGDASREWIRVCMPGVKSLSKSAQEMGLAELVKALEGYMAALELADREQGSGVSAQASELITGAYSELAAHMPGAFSLEEEGDRREPIIVQSLLAQIPDVRKVALDKIYAAGLTSLSAFYVAKPSDIGEATGLSLDLCHRIWERFQRYRRQISEMPPDVDRTAEHKRLSELAAQLAELNAAYEGRPGTGHTRDKKQVRQERTETMLEITMLLARLGEVRRVELLERLPFERKLEELERYLQAHNSKQRPF